MKTLQTVKQIRNGSNKSKLQPNNNTVAVIVTIPLSKRKQDLGIQFWTTEQIESCSVNNCKFVELF